MTKGEIYAVINNKGGVLKTSIVTNMAGVIAKDNNDVLIIDIDPQGGSTGRFGRNSDDEKHSLTDYLLGRSELKDIIKWVYERKIAIISANFELSLIEGYIEKRKITGQEITQKIEKLIIYAKKHFNKILIDTAPTFGRLTKEIINITDKIIIPTALEQDSFKGVVTTINVIQEAKMKEKITMIIPTLVKSRTNLHKNLLEQWLKPLAKEHNIKISNTIISDSIRVATITAMEKMPITLTNTKHKAKEVYFELAKELGWKHNKGGNNA